MAHNPRKYVDKEAKNSGNKNTSNEAAPRTSKAAALTRSGSIDTCKPKPHGQSAHPVLAERDLRLGRATWNKYVLPNQEFGTALFKELFQTYPNYEVMFMHMGKTQNKDLFSSDRFKVHTTQRVMNKLRDMMDSLDRPEELNDMMSKLGLYHVKLGVTRRHLENMQRVIVNSVRVSMNKQMQQDEEDSLNKCLAFAFHKAITAGEEYQQQAQAQAQAQNSSKTMLTTGS